MSTLKQKEDIKVAETSSCPVPLLLSMRPRSSSLQKCLLFLAKKTLLARIFRKRRHKSSYIYIEYAIKRVGCLR